MTTTRHFIRNRPWRHTWLQGLADDVIILSVIILSIVTSQQGKSQVVGEVSGF